MANKIQVRRGSKANLPVLEQAEFGFCTDTDEVYIGNGASNIPLSGGSGDVTGDDSSTDNAIPKFDGTGGKTIQNSGVIIDDDNKITGVAAITFGNFKLSYNSGEDSLDISYLG